MFARKKLRRAAQHQLGSAASAFVEQYGDVWARDSKETVFNADQFVAIWTGQPDPAPLVEAWRAVCDKALAEGRALDLLPALERHLTVRLSASYPPTTIVDHWQSRARSGRINETAEQYLALHVDAAEELIPNRPQPSQAVMQAAVIRDETRGELRDLVVNDPTFLPEWQGDPETAAEVVAQLVDHLINQRAGAYARLGDENGIGWGVLVNRLHELRTLNDAERTRMIPVCAYISQMSMLVTGMQELLAAQP